MTPLKIKSLPRSSDLPVAAAVSGQCLGTVVVKDAFLKPICRSEENMHGLSVPFLRARKVQDSFPLPRNELIAEPPETSGDVDWKDPFYDEEEDVMAVFLLDHEILDRKSKLFYDYMALFSIVVTCGIFVLYFVMPAYIFAFFAFYLGLILFIVFPILILEERSERHRRERTHIAITRQGVYVDETEEPSSKILQRRTIHRFNEIQKCSVERTEPFGLIIFQVILKNLNRKTVLKIDGLLGAHKFSETVNGFLSEENKKPMDDSSYIPPDVSVV
jgi:hypothetical protein